jgi:hypothetical protein
MYALGLDAGLLGVLKTGRLVRGGGGVKIWNTSASCLQTLFLVVLVKLLSVHQLDVHILYV